MDFGPFRYPSDGDCGRPASHPEALASAVPHLQRLHGRDCFCLLPRRKEGSGAPDPLPSGTNIVKDSSATGPNILNVNPLLDPLANNGGLTQTHALLSGSPAIDASTTGEATDQRGVTRPQGTNYDIGAFEVAVNLIVDNLIDEDDNNLSVGNTSLREILTRTSLNAITFDNTSLPTDGSAVITLSSSLGELLINRELS